MRKDKVYPYEQAPKGRLMKKRGKKSKTGLRGIGMPAWFWLTVLLLMLLALAISGIPQ